MVMGYNKRRYPLKHKALEGHCIGTNIGIEEPQNSRLRIYMALEGQQLYFLNTKNCLIFASAEGEDSERMRGCGGEILSQIGLTCL